jgi:hypothetical protein
MKYLLLLVTALSLIAAGCASTDNGDKPKPNQGNAKNPEVGMTKAQVLELYGKTDNQQMSSDGETWIYNLNMGEAFIPFNFGYRPKMRIIHFDREGKVVSWSYTK